MKELKMKSRNSKKRNGSSEKLVITSGCSLKVGRQEKNAIVVLSRNEGEAKVHIWTRHHLGRVRAVGHATLIGFGSRVRVKVLGNMPSGFISVSSAPVMKALAKWVDNAA